MKRWGRVRRLAGAGWRKGTMGLSNFERGPEQDGKLVNMHQGRGMQGKGGPGKLLFGKCNEQVGMAVQVN